MKQELDIFNYVDSDGNPTGGKVDGIGIAIRWQEGPLGQGAERKEPSGAFVEGVVQAAIARLKFYQETKFACRENAMALNRLMEALFWLGDRGVEGEHKK
jgi:hypothetical protein